MAPLTHQSLCSSHTGLGPAPQTQSPGGLGNICCPLCFQRSLPRYHQAPLHQLSLPQITLPEVLLTTPSPHLENPFLLSFSPKSPCDTLSVSLHTLIRPFREASPEQCLTQTLGNAFSKSCTQGRRVNEKSRSLRRRNAGKCTWWWRAFPRCTAVRHGHAGQRDGEGAGSRGRSPGSSYGSSLPLRPNFCGT